MKIQIISKGKTKRGIPTAEVVIKYNGKSQTVHLKQLGGVFGTRWTDRDGTTYSI
jgi:hypothetical protein